MFDYNDIKALEVFKWTAESIFKCETAKMLLAKNIKKGEVTATGLEPRTT